MLPLSADRDLECVGMSVYAQSCSCPGLSSKLNMAGPHASSNTLRMAGAPATPTVSGKPAERLRECPTSHFSDVVWCLCMLEEAAFTMLHPLTRGFSTARLHSWRRFLPCCISDQVFQGCMIMTGLPLRVALSISVVALGFALLVLWNYFRVSWWVGGHTCCGLRFMGVLI